jgi:hypothetical protein
VYFFLFFCTNCDGLFVSLKKRGCGQWPKKTEMGCGLKKRKEKSCYFLSACMDRPCADRTASGKKKTVDKTKILSRMSHRQSKKKYPLYPTFDGSSYLKFFL